MPPVAAQFLSTEEFAQQVGYNRVYLRRLIREKKIRASRIGRGRYLIPASELQKLIDPGGVLLMPPEEETP